MPDESVVYKVTLPDEVWENNEQYMVWNQLSNARDDINVDNQQEQTNLAWSKPHYSNNLSREQLQMPSQRQIQFELSGKVPSTWKWAQNKG